MYGCDPDKSSEFELLNNCAATPTPSERRSYSGWDWKNEYTPGAVAQKGRPRMAITLALERDANNLASTNRARCRSHNAHFSHLTKR
jgi:hypothetical protein